MSEVKESHLPCPMCDSSDAFTLYDDGHGFCFSCNKGKYPERNPTVARVKLDPSEAVDADGFRGISKKSCDRLGIKSYADEGGHIAYRTYDYPEGKRKIRTVNPKGFRVEGGSLPGLFAADKWTPGCAHYITVVEGEEDAAAFDTIFSTRTTPHPRPGCRYR